MTSSSTPRLRGIALLVGILAFYVVVEFGLPLLRGPVSMLLPAAAPDGKAPEVSLTRLAVQSSVYMIGTILITAVLVRADGMAWTDYGLHDRRWRANTCAGLLGGCVAFALLVAMMAVWAQVVINAKLQLGSALIYGVSWCIALGVAAAAEEIAYRGFLLRALIRLVGRWPAIFMTSAAFAFAHGANPAAGMIWMVLLICFGIAFAWVAVHSGSLWPSIGFHLGWNWTQEFLFGAIGSGYRFAHHAMELNISGPEWLTGGASGPEGSILSPLSLVIGVALISWAIRQRAVAAEKLS